MDNLYKKENNDLVICGKNAVSEAVKSAKPINAVYIQKGFKGFGELIAAVKKSGIVIKEVTAEKMNSLSNGVRHGGIAASLSSIEYSTVEEILADSGGDRRFILIVDGIEDPHNLGALIRTAEAAGVNGVIIPKHRNVQATAAVYAASAGAAAHMKIARATNLTDTIKTLKSHGVWVYGAEADGVPYSEVDFTGRQALALVIGSEGRGLGRLVRDNCDYIISVPMRGRVNSLNASVCGGILMFEMQSKHLGGVPDVSEGGGRD